MAPWMFSVALSPMPSDSTSTPGAAMESLVAMKPVRSIVSWIVKPLMLMVPRPLAALVPETVHFAPGSNCNDVKLVMELPSKPDRVPALLPDASSMTTPAAPAIVPENTAPGLTARVLPL